MCLECFWALPIDVFSSQKSWGASNGLCFSSGIRCQSQVFEPTTQLTFLTGYEEPLQVAKNPLYAALFGLTTQRHTSLSGSCRS